MTPCKLSVHNLRLKYPGGERKIFDGLSLDIKAKEKVLILGQSGSGKSTLLNVLSGVVPELIELPMKYDRLAIDASPAIIFQDPDSQFCMPKVYEELAFILENQQVAGAAMDSRIEQALQTVGLNVDKHQPINQLSGGMKQKLAIAGTLLQGADTLFLDEPTAMLDAQSTAALWQQIITLWEDQTVVIVEHKVEHIWQHVDRILLMDQNGAIIEDSTPDDISARCTSLLDDFGVWHPGAWSHAPEPYDYSSGAALFEFDGAVKRRRNTLYTASLDIASGEWITITGKNGAGKTTLLESIMQLIPYDGAMYYLGNRLKKLRTAAQYFYLVYQNPELQFIKNRVYDELYVNFYHQNQQTAHDETAAMLELLGLFHLKDHHPYELSMGQKRRLSVATALSTPAAIILLDEPTFGLDSSSTFELIKLFQQRIKSGQTIVMVTHDRQLIERYASRQLVVSDGQLKEAGGSDV
ncbi:ABC transporter ATP-binding protein [Macrococcus equipercicus]|uniref:ABC transporter ATP-binding protein n=1 Tax=Macrococcus equipercicus TaxID=69967 RepID=A0ABQ6R6I2_9STAP|nr:ABC transporter ATP-binding protein [Macrococcus equipercicus]KAA1036907.1 ABC transporter ATP-binding protein [Macrococcus equipercicus]